MVPASVVVAEVILAAHKPAAQAKMPDAFPAEFCLLSIFLKALMFAHFIPSFLGTAAMADPPRPADRKDNRWFRRLGMITLMRAAVFPAAIYKMVMEIY